MTAGGDERAGNREQSKDAHDRLYEWRATRIHAPC